jgi:colanic acid/amylovoran biosynthesis glycosyltransferase
MKILFCTNAFENVTNGPVRFANIILQINQLYPQHQLRILTEDVSEQRANVYKLPLYIPRLLKPFGQILRWFIYYRYIKKIEKEYNYDVLVYINSFNGLWASLVSDKPTVGMINDEKNMLATWQNFEFKPLWIKRFTFQWFEKLSAHRHRLIVTNSDFLNNRVIDTYQIPASKVKKLYKSIPLEGIVFNPHRTFESPIKVLFVKADYKVGQLAMLAEALKNLPKYQFLLTLVGPEPWFEADIRSIFTDKTNVSLNYVGAQPQAEVYSYMKSYDIFCVPSYTEAFGVANIEALAHGLSVISSRVGGIPEVLDNGNNGWLIDASRVGELSAAIEDCIQNPQKRLEKAINGQLFIQKFSTHAMLHQFVAMLEEVTEQPA